MLLASCPSATRAFASSDAEPIDCAISRHVERHCFAGVNCRRRMSPCPHIRNASHSTDFPCGMSCAFDAMSWSCSTASRYPPRQKISDAVCILRLRSSSAPWSSRSATRRSATRLRIAAVSAAFCSSVLASAAAAFAAGAVEAGTSTVAVAAGGAVGFGAAATHDPRCVGQCAL
eukprot:30960-Pelagococcus_subviridis.AAC.1